MNPKPDADLKKKIKKLRLLAMDSDGVLTDGGIIIVGEKEEARRFDVQDGLGIKLARMAGWKVAIVSSRYCLPLARRAEELNVDFVLQDCQDKLSALRDLASENQISLTETAYIGDDLPDLPVLKNVGIPIAVANTHPDVKNACVFITKSRGGYGAVREVIDWLLTKAGLNEHIYQQYLSDDLPKKSLS